MGNKNKHRPRVMHEIECPRCMCTFTFEQAEGDGYVHWVDCPECKMAILQPEARSRYIIE